MKKTVNLVPFGLIQDQIRFHVDVQVETKGSEISLEYSCIGDLTTLLMPDKKKEPIRSDYLWEHTCFEAFIAIGKNTSYWELNVSPSGDWNLYRFTDYRNGQEREDAIIAISSHLFIKAKNRFKLEVKLDLNSILKKDSLNNLQLGLTAVIEEKDHLKTYWALRHCGKQADFHIRDSFILEL
jgi:hypothetical protein